MKLLYGIILCIDYERSLLFLGPSSETPDTQMTTRCRPRFSRLAVSSLNARTRVHSLTKSDEKDCSQSILCITTLA